MYRFLGNPKETIKKIDETATSLEQQSKKQQEKLDEISDTLNKSALPKQESKPSKSFTDIFSGMREKLDESEAAFKRSKDELDKMKDDNSANKTETAVDLPHYSPRGISR